MINNILSILIFLPILLALPIMFFNKEKETLIKAYALTVSVITFLVSLVPFFYFNTDIGDFQFVEKVQWVKTLNTYYFVGIDGISLLMIVLTTFMMPLCIVASWKTIKKNLKNYFMLLLLLEGGLIGVFSSLDLLLFYFFWEFILIPMYFLIGMWGGENRVYATVKFFLYTMAGSVLLLVGIIWLGFLGTSFLGIFSTDLIALKEVSKNLPLDLQTYLFILFTLSFLIKVPLFPFHTWLPDAHVQAPTAGSVILAALLLKMGTYGLIRFSLTLFPAGFVKLTPVIVILAVIGIIYGALLSIVQKDMKKLVAYSSVSHLGFIVLGTFALTQEAMQGSVIQMVNHGLSTGALFLIVGMIYERRHTKEIAQFGGLMKVMPIFSVIFLIVVFSSIGLPGLNGFIGEFLVLIGSFNAPNLGSNLYVIFSTSAVILSAVYLLWLYQRVMLGPVDKPENQVLKDIDKTELITILPLIFFIIWIGVQPNTFLKITENSVKEIITNFQEAKVTIRAENSGK